MTEQLREAFRDLAESADHVAAPTGPHDLWRRGRRARRRRVASSVLVAGAVLTLLGAVLPVVGGPLRTTPAPASYDETDLAVPDHVWTPSSWAPVADEEDPPGPLALVAFAERRRPWLVTSSQEWYGVSAVDQSYRWLELPGQAQPGPGDVALSPDGLKVGYFLGGEPSAAHPHSDVTGFGVYDTVSGEVHRHRVPTRWGLSPKAISWGPDSVRLVVSYGQHVKNPSLITRGRTVAWDPEHDRVTVLDLPTTWDDAGQGLGGVTFWAEDDHRSVLVADPVSGRTRRLTFSRDDAESVASGAATDIWFNPSGDMVALRGDLPLGPGALTSGLHAARVVAGDRLVEPRLLGKGWQLNRILGWLDDERLLAEAHPRGGLGIRYVAYDVRTGAVDPAIGHTDPFGFWLQASFAQDLLLRPLVPGKAPPRPWHPWWAWAVAAVLLAVVALAGVATRRAGRKRVRVLPDRSAR